MLLRLLPQSLKPHEPPTLVLYTREEYRELAKALGIWEEAPRDTRSGTITLHTAAGATHPRESRTRPRACSLPAARLARLELRAEPRARRVILADRRQCPYLDAKEMMRPEPTARNVAAAAGQTCVQACKHAGGSCRDRELEWANSCEAMRDHFPCEAGCGHQVGTELPAYVTSPSLDTHQQCLITDIAFPKCDSKYEKTARLCHCNF